jgi:hypothetical protein
LDRPLKNEVTAIRMHWAAQYVVLSRVNVAAIDTVCVLVLYAPIAL